MNVGFVPQFLGEGEVRAVLDAAGRAQRETALTEGGYTRYREGQVAWIGPSPELDWLFERLHRFAQSFAGDIAVDVEHLETPLQLAVYRADDHFDWHIDCGTARTQRRKLTMVMQLSNAGEYEGGDLEVIGMPRSIWRRGGGSITVFPSVLGHRVTPVKRGERHALVAWMEGPPYR